MFIIASRRYHAILSLVILAGCASMTDTASSRQGDGRFEGPRRFALTPLAEMTPEQRALEMHRQHGVSDATFKRAVDALGEQGVADLIAVNGYYVLVAMTVTVDRTPIPNGGLPPMPNLK